MVELKFWLAEKFYTFADWLLRDYLEDDFDDYVEIEFDFNDECDCDCDYCQ